MDQSDRGASPGKKRDYIILYYIIAHVWKILSLYVSSNLLYTFNTQNLPPLFNLVLFNTAQIHYNTGFNIIIKIPVKQTLFTLPQPDFRD